jgi:hypothetical protein
MSRLLHPRERSLSGADSPCRIDPSAIAPPRRSAILYPIFTGAEVGDDQDVGLAGRVGAGSLGGSDRGNQGRVELQLTVDSQPRGVAGAPAMSPR